MATYTIQTSFAAGELSPALYARVDLAKYHSGAALLRNFLVDYRGGASTRGGSRFLGIADSVGRPRLLPFQFSTEAAYALLFGDHFIWFISNGAILLDDDGAPIELESPYTSADFPLLKYVQSADVMTLTHPMYPPYNLTRTGPDTFILEQDVIGPVIEAPSGVVATAVGGTGTTQRYSYIVTAVGPDDEESSISTPVFVDNDTLDQDAGKVNRIEWTGQASAVSYNIYKVGQFPATQPSPTVFGFIGSSIAPVFIDNNIAPDFSATPPQFADPFSPGQVASITVGVSTSTFTGEAFEPLTFTGDGAGAVGYGIVDPATGNIIGAWLVNPGKGYSHVTVADSSGLTAYTAVVGQQGGTYPFACGYFNQRRVFGGTTNFPESFVMSQPGLYNNFDTSPIVKDSDAITANIASRQVNAIKSFTAVANGLIVLTTGAGFLVTGGGSANQAVTPSNITAYPQPSSGCNDLEPLVINQDVLYAQNRGAVVRDLAFNFYIQSYAGTDRSVLASHLFTGFELQEWAYSEEPFRLVPTVRSDGVLLIFTYVPEQEIFAWTHYDTNGFFLSVCSIPEGNVNAIYVVVERNTGSGKPNLFYIERMDDRLWPTAQDTWCLDSALALPPVFPQASVALDNGTDPNSIRVFADSAIFTANDVGKSFWAGGGWAKITEFVSTSILQGDIYKSFPKFTDNPGGLFVPYAPEQWELRPNVTHISGLDHLEGQVVMATIDGTAAGPFTVTNGSVTLPFSGSKVVVGLGYQCQLQTLKLDLGDPTIQAKRKQISGATLRVNDSIGLSFGPTFARLAPMKELISPYPSSFISDDAIGRTYSQWDKAGQLCIQQDLPLPATVLGIIFEVLVGDTQR